jgi:curved DNA-binding protein CbpA
VGDKAIAAAYKRLAREFHPDIAGESATLQMMRINAAFDAIRTAQARAEYDDQAHATAGSAPRYGNDDGSGSRMQWSQERDGTGGAGPPPGRPSGTVIPFGRHIGWSIGEIARVDPGYLVWLEERPEGRPYRAEIDATLRRHNQRTDDQPQPDPRGRKRTFGHR